MSTGHFDDDGIWIYGEDDPAGPSFAETLNKGQRSVGPAVSGMVAASLADDDTPAAAAALAVAGAVANSPLTTGQGRSGTDVSLFDVNGMQMFKVKDVFGYPYFEGTTPSLEAFLTPGSSVRTLDGNGVALWDSSEAASATTTYRETWVIPDCGQSNGMGVFATPIAPFTNEPLPNLFMVPQSGAQAGQLLPAADPMAHNRAPAILAGTRGHGVEFGRWLARRNPDVRIVIVPLSVTGTGLYYTGGNSTLYSWAPDREGESGVTNLFRDAITKTNAVIASFAGGTVRVPAILWQQMESDAVGAVAAATYKGDATHGVLGIIDGFRAQMTNAADAAFLVGQTAWEFRNVRKPGTYAELDTVLAGLPADRAHVGFAPAPGAGYCNADNTHFTGAGQWLLAQSYQQAYIRAVYSITGGI